MEDFFEKAFEPTVSMRIAIAGSICGKNFNSLNEPLNIFILY